MIDDIFKCVSEKDFKDRFFQKKPYHFKSSCFNPIVEWKQINRLLERDIIKYPRIRLANDENPMSRGYGGFMSYSITPTNECAPHINTFNLKKNLKEGSTLIIDRYHNYDDLIYQATEQIQKTFSCRSVGNLYASWTRTSSFGTHFDNHDVIAHQYEGEKCWKVYNPTYEHPMLGHKSFDFTPPSGKPDYEFIISPGEFLYIPAGYWHNVTSINELSLHMSYTMVRPRKIELLQMIVGSLQDHEFMREPISVNPDSISNSELKSMLLDLIKGTDFDLWESELIKSCINRRFIKMGLPEL